MKEILPAGETEGQIKLIISMLWECFKMDECKNQCILFAIFLDLQQI